MGFGSEEVVAISPLCPKHRLDAAHSEQVKRKRPMDRDINATHDFWAPLRMRSGAGGLMSRRLSPLMSGPPPQELLLIRRRVCGRSRAGGRPTPPRPC